MNVVKSVAILAVIGLSVYDPAREMLIALLTPRTHHFAAPVIDESGEVLPPKFITKEWAAHEWADYCAEVRKTPISREVFDRCYANR